MNGENACQEHGTVSVRECARVSGEQTSPSAIPTPLSCEALFLQMFCTWGGCSKGEAGPSTECQARACLGTAAPGRQTGPCTSPMLWWRPDLAAQASPASWIYFLTRDLRKTVAFPPVWKTWGSTGQLATHRGCRETSRPEDGPWPTSPAASGACHHGSPPPHVINFIYSRTNNSHVQGSLSCIPVNRLKAH